MELGRVDGRYVRTEPKTKRSRRTVPLAQCVVDALAGHRDRLRAQGFVTVATGPVFVNRSGGPLSGTWLTHAWQGVLELAGLDPRPWKILRATFASRLHGVGVQDRDIADLLGHARTHTTQRHYVSTAGSDLRADIEGVLSDSHRDSHRDSHQAGESSVDERGSGEPRRTRTSNMLIKSQLPPSVKRAV